MTAAKFVKRGQIMDRKRLSLWDGKFYKTGGIKHGGAFIIKWETFYFTGLDCNHKLYKDSEN